IDSVTVGEPEFTTLELARYTLSKQKNTVKINIPGLAFRNKDGNVVYHPRQPIQDLDLLPYPYRQDIDLYAKKGIAVYILGSRGCYGHCTFCYLNPFYGQGNNWRGRSAKNIFEEMLKLYTEYSINNFYFSDANFLGPGKHGRRRAVTLAELILMHDININFGFECRVNDIEEYSLSMLVMAGLTNVFLGLESGDPESLSRFKKNTTVEGNKRAIQLLRDYGIEPTYGFIMFEPGSTLKSVKNNFEFLKETNIMTTPAVTAHLLHHKETILKGTPDYLTITNKTTRSNSFTNYEAFYKIRNPEVEAFSEIIANVCKKALSLLPAVHSCQNAATDTGINSDSLAKLNNILIALFEKTLSDFEKNNLAYNSDSIKKLSQELIYEVERAIK
ncbi:MAG: radical SAM protein, partial [Candidatus Brocadiales bacterium]|nr:radical SAM protein [Candidatus Brocadiales bacterium]